MAKSSLADLVPVQYLSAILFLAAHPDVLHAGNLIEVARLTGMQLDDAGNETLPVDVVLDYAWTEDEYMLSFSRSVVSEKVRRKITIDFDLTQRDVMIRCLDQGRRSGDLTKKRNATERKNIGRLRARGSWFTGDGWHQAGKVSCTLALLVLPAGKRRLAFTFPETWQSAFGTLVSFRPANIHLSGSEVEILRKALSPQALQAAKRKHDARRDPTDGAVQ